VPRMLSAGTTGRERLSTPQSSKGAGLREDRSPRHGTSCAMADIRTTRK
jgi:hypothetical protein